MSIYIGKPKDDYKGQVVEETIKILRRDYGFQEPVEHSGKESDLYILTIPLGLNGQQRATLNALVRKLRKEHDIKAGIVDMVTEVLIESLKKEKL